MPKMPFSSIVMLNAASSRGPSQLACSIACLLLTACSTANEGTSTSNGRDPSRTPDAGNDASGSNPDVPNDSGVPAPPGFEPTGTPFHVDATGQAGLDKATLDELRAGGASCTTPIIYPYEATVFPGGLIPPPLMWQADSKAAYVQVSYDTLDLVQYQFAGGPTSPGELRVPAKDWYEITRRTQGTPLRVKLSVKTASGVSTCETSFRIAAGNMVGSVYYNTYNLPELDGVGAVLRLQLGQPKAESYLTTAGVSPTGPCVSCHSVSANGSTIAASTHLYGPLGTASYEVSAYSTNAGSQPTKIKALENGAYGALTPDGGRMLTMGNPDCTGGADTFPRGSNNFPFVEGTSRPTLLNVMTGADLKASFPDGFNGYMWMPQFSPDGRHVVFNHAKPDGQGGTDRRELATMDFDPTSNAFTNLRVLASKEGPAPSLSYAPGSAGLGFVMVPAGPGRCGTPDPGALIGETGTLAQGTCTGPCYPAWPSFTPDGKGVVFSLTSEPDFLWALPGRETPSKSELWYVDTKTLKRVRLDNANKGLPAESKLINYYPTVLPVQVGGYYWLFWTSTREFGHHASGASAFPIALAGKAKRLWVSAIRPQAPGEGTTQALTDPSAPGFYLEGQTDTGNARAFASLNPCVAQGSACTSGLDCCGGYCTIQAGQEKGTCADEAPSCAALNEKCANDKDCCAPTNADESARLCVGGYCGFLVVQ